MTSAPALPAGMVAAATGGALGALGRYAVANWFPVPVDGFPWSTFAVNVVGAALLALLPTFALVRSRPWLPVFLGTGLLGGFTTMSAASAETFALLDRGHAGLAFGYAVGTVVAAVAAVALVDGLSSRGDRLGFAELEGDE